MKHVIEKYKNLIVQIATPYTGGTGFCLLNQRVIVTNAHVVRDNKNVVVITQNRLRYLSELVFLDEKYDIAFLSLPENIADHDLELCQDCLLSEGDEIIALGHPFGLKFTATRGIISNIDYSQNNTRYIQHDASLNPGNSGGPIIDSNGKIIGINAYILAGANNMSYALPVEYLIKDLNSFENMGKIRCVKCSSCETIVKEGSEEITQCPSCGNQIDLISAIPEFMPIGIAEKIEHILSNAGFNPLLSRCGIDYWEVKRGSALIEIRYHERSGIIEADAHLAKLPENKFFELYSYLLQQNQKLESLNFSLHQEDIILSLLIYDRFLNEETCGKLFVLLFERADYYDDILIKEYGAREIYRN